MMYALRDGFTILAANDEERLRCVKEVLHVNPNNEKAKQIYVLNGLEILVLRILYLIFNPLKKSTSTRNDLGVIVIVFIIIGLLLFYFYLPLQVMYKITGTTPDVFITYQTAKGGTAQTFAGIPWKYTMTVTRGIFLLCVPPRIKRDMVQLLARYW